jgi:hypothetical protein
VYMRRLIGAPGDFLRIKLKPTTVDTLAELLADDSLRYAQTFGRVYTCCGKCGAPLTDDESRRLAIGPKCRGAWGL